MYQRIGKRKYSVYAFDIETHNDEESIAKKTTSMWLGSFINEESKIDDEASYFYNMNDFILHLEKLSSSKRKSSKQSRPVKNLCIYVFNFSFEWSFILPVLLNDFNFTFKESIEAEDEFVFNSVSTKSCSSVWTAQLKFHKDSGIIIFKDLAKIFGGSLRNVAKAFQLETQKGDIDYRLNRLHDHVVTKEEKEYCFKDTRIIIDILLKMQEKGDKLFFNSSSMASYSMKSMLQFTYFNKYKKYKEFRKDYPALDQEETDFLRKGVEGGITYAPSSWQFKNIEGTILHIDAHQMHPSQMASKLFPYGFGTYGKGKPVDYVTKINACRIKISYYGVRLHSIIKLIGLDMVDDFELVVWDFEIPTMYKCYIGLEIEYIDFYAYKCKKLPFAKYIVNNYKKRLQAKKNKDAFFTLYYKLLNNSAYGKFLEKPHNQIMINTIREDGIIDSILEDKEFKEVNAKYTYLGVGSCIPAYSRVTLIETALKLSPSGKDIVYFDTDSIFALYTEEVKENWERGEIGTTEKLGDWAIEEWLTKAQFTAPKRYKAMRDDGTFYVKMAGVNGLDNDFPFDEINITSASYEVQRAFRCKGGTIIDLQRKDINIQPKYEEIYLHNTNKDL